MATYLDPWFDAQEAKRDGIIRRYKGSINMHDRMFEQSLARCKRQGFHLLETTTRYVVLCNAGDLKVHC